MCGRLNLHGRLIAICLLAISALIETSSRPQDFTLSMGGISSHDIPDEHRKEGLTREQLSQEAWVWHRANKQRLAETHPLGEQALTTQINVQVPRTTSSTTIVPAVQSSTSLVEVISNGALIRAGTFQIAPAVPALFTTNQSGTGGVAALDAFTNAPGPFNARQANGQPNIIAVFGTGLGADATDVDGDVKATVQATIGGNAMAVSYAGRAPGFTGLNQFNLTFPANLTAGTYDLIVSRNGIPARTVTVTVK